MYYTVFIIRQSINKCFKSVKNLKNPKIIPIEDFFKDKSEDEILEIYNLIKSFNSIEVEYILEVWKNKIPFINTILSAEKYNL